MTAKLKELPIPEAKAGVGGSIEASVSQKWNPTANIFAVVLSATASLLHDKTTAIDD